MINFSNRNFVSVCCLSFRLLIRQKLATSFGEIGGKAVFQNLARLGPAYKRFDQMIRSKQFLSFIGRITGIPNLLYDPEYVGGGTHDNLEGQELDPHVDFNYHPKTHTHRRLNLILYLNPDWREDWGGSLELHLNPWIAEENIVKTIIPAVNRCVLFETSERSWHGFSKIRLPEGKKGLSRRSIAVYFYTRQRPPAETAAPHSTVYVQRPLPDRIRAGYTLAQDDARLLKDLLKRRDQQIQFLYEREQEFSSVIASMARSPSFRLGRMLLWPARTAAALLGFRRVR